MKKKGFLDKLSVIFRILFNKDFLYVEVKSKNYLKHYTYRTNIKNKEDIIYLERVLNDLKENYNSLNK